HRVRAHRRRVREAAGWRRREPAQAGEPSAAGEGAHLPRGPRQGSGIARRRDGFGHHGAGLEPGHRRLRRWRDRRRRPGYCNRCRREQWRHPRDRHGPHPRGLSIGPPNPTESSMKALNLITLALVIIGGINWGLVGLAQFDLVAAIFGGQDAALARVVYTLVGVSALWQIG